MKWKKTRRNICGQLTPGLTCLSALCTPAQPTSVNSSPWTRTSFSHPFQEARSPQAGAPPPPLSSRLTDLLCAGDELGVGRETWGRGSQPHLQRSPELGPPTGTRSRHRAGKRRQWGLVGGRGPGGR